MPANQLSTTDDLLIKILKELQETNSILANIRAGMNGDHEILMDKLAVLESIADKSRDVLKSIDSNTKV